MRVIEVVPYDSKWEKEFKKAKEFYSKILKELNVEIEHVGSTSVEGLQAKPILDIDIIVQTQKESHRVIKALEEVGYEHIGNMGIEGRDAFLYDKGNPQLTWIQHNLYVCIKGSESLNNHLLLRNHLKKNKEAVEKYGALKKELAKRYPNDIDSYVEGKSELIASFLHAEGMSKEALLRIENANKKE
ncbi:GrpB family protein [Anaeromicrobium sediminis]|uniref:GrpB family protein n=1 Tax=Anaeromicrobium sediminis TaxID=1478221 RepID=A0A267ML60_9FIRM|nr:GrpB family protein [Anaeromicrobium sediminis]PAB60319.1 hypothetical protein CCE28_05330 [Anaeromicrobium sediminis]